MTHFTWQRSSADSWNALANMTSLNNINPDGAHGGQQRSLEDLQFDPENMLTMSQLVGKSAEERNAASVMLDILAGTKARLQQSLRQKSSQKRQRSVAGRTRMIVREDGLGPSCEKSLVETPVRRVSQKCFNTVA